MEDDTKLKIVFYTIIIMAVIIIIGIWESFIRPVAIYLLGPDFGAFILSLFSRG